MVVMMSSLSHRLSRKKLDVAPNQHVQGLMKPPPGPKSDFFRLHEVSLFDGLHRNTRLHWALHWNSFIQGRSLIPISKAERARVKAFQKASVQKQTRRMWVWHMTEMHPVWNLIVFSTIWIGAISDMIETALTPANVSGMLATERIEIFCVVVFTLELVVRVSSCPSRVRFVMSVMNWIDLVAILPWYIEAIVARVDASTKKSPLTSVSTTIRLLRLGRMLRVIKFGRYSSSVRMFTVACGQSLRSLAILIIITLIIVLLFGTILYNVEQNVDPADRTDGCGAPCFASILSSCWNVINTVTTVGYGDSVPYTMLGKITATAASVCGIVVLALPIAVFENNFARMNASRDLCHRFIQEISNHYSGPIDVSLIERWIAGQQHSDRMQVISSLPSHALASLEATDLLATYDLDGKGFLSEEEALLMMADLFEFHAPDDTARIDAIVTQMTDVVKDLAEPLHQLESHLLKHETLFGHVKQYQLRRQMTENLEAPRYERSISLFSMRGFARAIRMMSTRQSWQSPMNDGTLVNLGRPRRKSSSSSGSETRGSLKASVEASTAINRMKVGGGGPHPNGPCEGADGQSMPRGELTAQELELVQEEQRRLDQDHELETQADKAAERLMDKWTDEDRRQVSGLGY